MGIIRPVLEQPGLFVRKIGAGTSNILNGPAMTRDQAIRAIRAGAEVVDELIKGGMDILATGDMGIGNTTPSTAIASLVCEYPVEKMTGKEPGLMIRDWIG